MTSDRVTIQQQEVGGASGNCRLTSLEGVCPRGQADEGRAGSRERWLPLPHRDNRSKLYIAAWYVPRPLPPSTGVDYRFPGLPT